MAKVKLEIDLLELASRRKQEPIEVLRSLGLEPNTTESYEDYSLRCKRVLSSELIGFKEKIVEELYTSYNKNQHEPSDPKEAFNAEMQCKEEQKQFLDTKPRNSKKKLEKA